MWCAERDEQEQRSVSRGLENTQGLARDQVGRVSLFFGERSLTVPRHVTVFVAMRILVHLTVQGAVCMIEPILPRTEFTLESQMPLSRDRRLISDATQDARVSPVRAKPAGK